MHSRYRGSRQGFGGWGSSLASALFMCPAVSATNAEFLTAARDPAIGYRCKAAAGAAAQDRSGVSRAAVRSVHAGAGVAEPGSCWGSPLPPAEPPPGVTTAAQSTLPPARRGLARLPPKRSQLNPIYIFRQIHIFPEFLKLIFFLIIFAW